MLGSIKRHICTSALSEALSKEKVKQLQTLCMKIGITQTGTKNELIHRLTDQVAQFSPISEHSSVFSFDMGYRNLAYCHLDKNAKIIDWCRLDLELVDFHPSAVAPAVRELVKTRIQPQLKETQAIVVEQQRARSSSGISVFEGTLRVNCVEAILWTALYEAVEHHHHHQTNNSIIMRPIRRQTIDKLFEADLDQVISNNASTFNKFKGGSYKKKQAVSLLVQQWLETGTVVDCETRFKTMFELEKKRDDLSDCLTQALAWYKWQKFTQNFITHFEENNEIINVV